MKNMYTTGTFAKMANVTERTIRYYDKIGLLKPSFVMENGYRQYTDKDFIKLQKILSLKSLGFSIEEIFPMVMDESSDNLKNSLNDQIDLISERIKHLQSLKDSLNSLKKSVEVNNFNWNKVVDLIHLTNMESNLVEHYKNTKNLNARISLHDKYSTNKEGWFPWVYRHISFDGVNRLLEIGCGNGKLWENTNINLRNREIFLSDISEGMVNEVRNKMGNDFNCIVADCEKIPFKDSYFDAIVANHVLFYVKDLNNGLSEIVRCLKEDGTFYCSTYGITHMKEISEIVNQFDSRVVLSENKLFDKFGLENGETILKKYFKKVNKVTYEDSLEIDCAQPIIDYIMSCHGNQNEILGPRLDEFKKYIEHILQEEKNIHVSKDAGLFICKK